MELQFTIMDIGAPYHVVHPRPIYLQVGVTILSHQNVIATIFSGTGLPSMVARTRKESIPLGRTTTFTLAASYLMAM